MFQSYCTVMEQVTKANFMKVLIWLIFTNGLFYLFVKIINMPWELQLRDTVLVVMILKED